MATTTEDSLGDVLDRLSNAEGRSEVRVGDVIDTLADRSLGVILVALGLIAAIPVIGAIPGVSIAVGALALVALGQRMLGRSRGRGIWTPDFVRRRSFDRDAFHRGVAKARPAVEWIDRRLGARLQTLAAGPGRGTAMTLASATLAAAMFPLAIVPWGVVPPALGLVAFGLAMIARDGVMALIGYALTAATLLAFLGVV
mgnify:FL=1